MPEVLRPATPVGGWPRPWPDVAELAASAPAQAWTLIGGLMVQLHGIAAGLPVVRPTNDVDGPRVLVPVLRGGRVRSRRGRARPFEDREPSGSDQSRLLHLGRHLADPTAPAWPQLREAARRDGQAALDLLCG